MNVCDNLTIIYGFNEHYWFKVVKAFNAELRTRMKIFNAYRINFKNIMAETTAKKMNDLLIDYSHCLSG